VPSDLKEGRGTASGPSLGPGVSVARFQEERRKIKEERDMSERSRKDSKSKS
jgi:hypothetical protein